MSMIFFVLFLNCCAYVLLTSQCLDAVCPAVGKRLYLYRKSHYNKFDSRKNEMESESKGFSFGIFSGLAVGDKRLRPG